MESKYGLNWGPLGKRQVLTFRGLSLSSPIPKLCSVINLTSSLGNNNNNNKTVSYLCAMCCGSLNLFSVVPSMDKINCSNSLPHDFCQKQWGVTASQLQTERQEKGRRLKISQFFSMGKLGLPAESKKDIILLKNTFLMLSAFKKYPKQKLTKSC